MVATSLAITRDFGSVTGYKLRTTNRKPSRAVTMNLRLNPPSASFSNPMMAKAARHLSSGTLKGRLLSRSVPQCIITTSPNRSVKWLNTLDVPVCNVHPLPGRVLEQVAMFGYLLNCRKRVEKYPDDLTARGQYIERATDQSSL